jgi:DnaJ-domain-containing protein 1
LAAAGGSSSSSSSSSSTSSASAYSSCRSWTDEAASEEEAVDGDDVNDAMADDADLVAMEAVDLYEVLGVERCAKQEEIRRSYRWLQKKCHPDIAGPALGHSMAILLNHAYKTLSDPNQRAAYDQVLLRDLISNTHD